MQLVCLTPLLNQIHQTINVGKNWIQSYAIQLAKKGDTANYLLYAIQNSFNVMPNPNKNIYPFIFPF